MLKQKLIKGSLPYLIIFLGLFFAGIISFLLVSPTKSSKVEYTENKVPGVTKTAEPVNPTPQPSASVKVKPSIKSGSYKTPNPTTNSQSNNSVTTQAKSPEPIQTPQTNQISVSINGSSSFTVSVTDGVNQCDVLSKALSDGKISSLNMRYDSNFGTYAVYQINGIGKENSVWWTYTVNNQSPNQGCSYVKAKNNDNVEWKYIGS